MKKSDALKIIFDCAEIYHNQLENNNLLFVFGTVKSTQYLEAVFLARNFLHLTGVVYHKRSLEFYNAALDKRLGISDFSLIPNGTSEMKLLVLPKLMEVYHSAKMIGDYNSTKSVLYTEKLAGNITACLGFIRKGRYYIPNTALKEDIRDVTYKPQQRILAIFRKSIKEKTYHELCYAVKDIHINNLIVPKNVKVFLDFDPE